MDAQAPFQELLVLDTVPVTENDTDEAVRCNSDGVGVLSGTAYCTADDASFATSRLCWSPRSGSYQDLVEWCTMLMFKCMYMQHTNT